MLEVASGRLRQSLNERKALSLLEQQPLHLGGECAQSITNDAEILHDLVLSEGVVDDGKAHVSELALLLRSVAAQGMAIVGSAASHHLSRGLLARAAARGGADSPTTTVLSSSHSTTIVEF